MTTAETITSQIIEIKQISTRTKLFTIQAPSKFSFIPGQFVILSIPGFANEKGILIQRSYSIASSPLQKGIIELCIAIVDGGKFSSRLQGLKIGDEVNISGPYGNFILKKPVAENTIFIAGGTGIAPIISMLRTLYFEKYPCQLQLFYGIRNRREFLYREDLADYAKNNKLKPVVAVSETDENWNGEQGVITEILQKHIAVSQDAYICGPPAMVEAIVAKLKQLGFKNEQINKEQW